MQHEANTATLPRLVGVPEAARDLGISPRGLWSLISKGHVPSVRIGKRRLLRREVVDRIASEGLPT